MQAVQSASRLYGDADPQFSYVVTGLLVNGDTYSTAITGVPIYSAGDTSTLAASTTLPINVSGLTSRNYQIFIVSGTLTIITSPTTTALVESTATAQYASPVTLTATVAPSIATGIVVFMQGSTVLGTATVSGGIATLTTSSLPVGSYTVTASYEGDSNYSESTSTPVTLTISPPVGTDSVTAVYSGDGNFTSASSTVDNQVVGNTLDFALTLTSAVAQNVIPGNTASYTLQITPTNTLFPGTVTFSAIGLPPGAAISLSPSTVAANGGTAPIRVSVRSAPQSQSMNRRQGSALLALGLLTLPLAFFRRICERRHRILLLVVLGWVSAIVGLTGCCSYNGNGFFGQAPQNYTITITATSGMIQHSVSVTLNEQ